MNGTFPIPGRDPIATTVVVGAMLFLSGWYSGAETGLYQLNLIRLRLKAVKGDHRADVLSNLLGDQQGLICALLLGTNWTNYLAASVVTAYCMNSGLSDRQAEMLTTAILTPMIFIFAETIPKNLFLHQANKLMYASSRFIFLNTFVLRFTGILYLFKAISGLLLRAVHGLPEARQIMLPGHDLGYLLREGHAAGAMTAVQSDIAQRILSLPEKKIARVMIPIWRTLAVPEDISREQFLQLIRHHTYARLPVYRMQKNNVIGLVNVYDVLSDPRMQPPAEHIKPVVRVSPSDPVMPVLYQLQRRYNPMAIVVNRRGQAMGIVTIKDIVEEIVGELGKW